MNQVSNASQFPRTYYARHMYPGIAGYDNMTILVDVDACKRMCKSFEGCPVYIDHQDVDLENLKEQASGYVTQSFYNPVDGWLWCKFIAIDDEIEQAIAQGWSVSNSYLVSEWGMGGTKHNCNYDKEIVNGTFSHLAIVQRPRYEDAKIYTPDEFKGYQAEKEREMSELSNSKQKEKRKMLKLFKNKKEPVTEVDDETMVEITNDDGSVEEVSIAQMRNSVSKKKSNDGNDDYAREDDLMAKTVNVDGEDVSVKELANMYKRNMKKRKSSNMSDDDEEYDNMSHDDGDGSNYSYDRDYKDEHGDEYSNMSRKNMKRKNMKKRKNMDDDDEEYENMDDYEKPTSRVAESDNSLDGRKKDNKHYQALKNAPETVQNEKPMIDTPQDAVARGRERY